MYICNRGVFVCCTTAVEFMDREVVDIVLTHLPLHNPLSSSHPFYVLVETSGSHDQHDKEVGTPGH